MSGRLTKSQPEHSKGKSEHTVRKALVELLKVRTIITFAVFSAFIYLAVTDSLEGQTVFMSVASSVVTYYFARKVTAD